MKIFLFFQLNCFQKFFHVSFQVYKLPFFLYEFSGVTWQNIYQDVEKKKKADYFTIWIANWPHMLFFFIIF